MIVVDHFIYLFIYLLEHNYRICRTFAENLPFVFQLYNNKNGKFRDFYVKENISCMFIVRIRIITLKTPIPPFL